MDDSVMFWADETCVCGFFDRHGGTSVEPYTSLNVAMSVGDREHDVLANRAAVRAKIEAKALLTAHQVHGDRLYVLNKDIESDTVVDGYDAMITDRKGVGLMIQTADCQGILFHDPVQEAAGAAHSGWRGSVKDIAAVTVEGMVREYGTAPPDLRVYISPSLGPCCAEFVNYREELPERFTEFMVADNHFDFWRITRQQLLDCGVRDENITVAGRCTSCSGEYFSYRRACRNGDGVTGRNCSVIVLR